MVRWLRFAIFSVLLLVLMALGAVIGLLLVENSDWVVIRPHAWFADFVDNRQLEVRLPVLIGGWLFAVLSLWALLAWSLFYVWRRRQYESLIRRIERELIELRNLPFTRPAPLSDEEETGLAETPSMAMAEVLRGPRETRSTRTRRGPLGKE